MCREYTYFWPTFNGALVAKMSPNLVFWYLFFKIALCWVCFAHLHHIKVKKVHFFLKNLPTLGSAYGPANGFHTSTVLFYSYRESEFNNIL